MRPKVVKIPAALDTLLEQLPELDQQAWLPVIEMILELPTGEQDAFISLARPIIEMQLSRVASLQQIGRVATDQAGRIQELMALNEDLRDELQSQQSELSNLRETLIQNGLLKNPQT